MEGTLAAPNDMMTPDERDGFLWLPPDVVTAIRKVEEAREQYALHAWSAKTTREQRNDLQAAKVRARQELSAAIASHTGGRAQGGGVAEGHNSTVTP